MSIICRLPVVCPLLVVGVQPLTLERWGAGRISSPGRRTTARSGWKKHSLLSRSGWKNKQSLLRRSHTPPRARLQETNTPRQSAPLNISEVRGCVDWCTAASFRLSESREGAAALTPNRHPWSAVVHAEAAGPLTRQRAVLTVSVWLAEPPVVHVRHPVVRKVGLAAVLRLVVLRATARHR